MLAPPLSRAVAEDIINALRDGTVPSEGLDQIAVGLEQQLGAMLHELKHVATRRGNFKAIRGEWGAGKTFLSRLFLFHAAQQDFVTAHVILSAQETRLFRLEEVYRAIVRGLTIKGAKPGALAQLLERWIARQARAVADTEQKGFDHPEHEAAVARRIERELGSIGTEATSFAMALGAYYTAKRSEDFATARGLIGVLSCDPNVGAEVKRRAGIKGELDGTVALAYLRAVLEVIHGAGLPGLAVVLDEGDRLTQLRGPERNKSWEVLRKLLDELAANRFPGLYLVLTGTRELFEGKKGIKEYGALDQRLSVEFREGEPEDYRQRQIRIPRFDKGRLVEVARRVREIFPAQTPARVTAKVNDQLLDAMATQVTQGFGGKVEVIPRVFLREWVRQLSLVDQHPDYEPAAKYRFELSKVTDLSNEEKLAAGLASAVDTEVEPQVF